MKKKKECHFFTKIEYQREAAYLRQMHQSGWKLVKVSCSPLLFGAIYTFEESKPEDMTYVVIPTRIGFGLKKIGIQAWGGDHSWEEIQGLNQATYFRKPTDLIGAQKGTNESEIFRQVRMTTRQQLYPYGIILVTILLPKWLRGELFTVWWSLGLFMLLNLIYLYILGRSFYYMTRLSKGVK